MDEYDNGKQPPKQHRKVKCRFMINTNETENREPDCTAIY